MTDKSMQVAKTILAQLGGMQRLTAMVGARNMVALESGLQFGHMRTSSGVNKTRIELNPNDTYTVQFWKVQGVDCTKLSEVSGVHVDSLIRTVEQGTGLVLHL